MKTAMQELIEWGDEMLLKHPQKILGFGEAIDKAVELLEKEKDQIITAFEVGYKSCDLDETFEINRKLASGELHYNKTYK
jgi:predicted GNAT superfamily acetyltransferase